MAGLKFNTEASSKILLVSAIILLMSSFFIPLVLVYLIQDSLYLSGTQWFYDTPASAYITFMIGMIWIPILMIVHVIIQWKYEFRYLKWITLSLMSLSIPFFMFGVSNYYYLDGEGLHYNDLKTFNTITSYKWEDVAEAKEVFTKSNGVTVMDHYRFITEDGDVIDLEYNNKVREHKFRILEKLKEHDIEITSNLGDLYE